MSAIISAQMAYSGVGLYAIVRDLSGLVANGTGLESYNVSNYANYIITMAEQVPTGYFKVAFPAYLPAGKYSFSVHQVVGGAAAAGDQAVDQGDMDWNGASENYVGLIVAKLPSGSISGFDPTASAVNLNNNQTGVTVGTVNALGTSAAASVKTQIDTSLGSDVMAELSAVPASTPTLKTAIMFLLMAFRNKRTSTSTTVAVYNASGAVISSAAQSDNGSIYTKNNFS